MNLDKIKKIYERRINQLTKDLESQIDRANYWGNENVKLQIKIFKIKVRLDKISHTKSKAKKNG